MASRVLLKVVCHSHIYFLVSTELPIVSFFALGLRLSFSSSMPFTLHPRIGYIGFRAPVLPARHAPFPAHCC
jgi:hypothetical protein